MRKSLSLLFFLAVVLFALPSFGGSCSYQAGGGGAWYQCINTSPSYNSNWTLYSPGTQMCSIGGDYYYSTGTYGSATIEWSFTSESTTSDTVDISFVLDLKNSHSSNLNRISVIVYNDTDSTAETIATIDGSGGDICSGTYNYNNLYRPAWDNGKSMRIAFVAMYWHSDAQFNFNSASYIQRP